MFSELVDAGMNADEREIPAESREGPIPIRPTMTTPVRTRNLITSHLRRHTGTSMAERRQPLPEKRPAVRKNPCFLTDYALPGRK